MTDPVSEISGNNAIILAFNVLQLLVFQYEFYFFARLVKCCQKNIVADKECNAM